MVPRNDHESTSLVNYEALPKWLQDNAYIRTGYRRPQYSWFGCARSVFGCASALFHAANCHSPSVSNRCHMLDYTGIVVLIVGSFYPCVYYGFYCDPYLQASYIGAITVAGFGAAYIVLSPHYSTPSYRWARTIVFLALGLTAIVPVTHALWLYGFARLRNEMGLAWLLLSGMLYVVGALTYASRMPERWYPGRFDYFGASHQIFHTCVVLAALAHYECITTAFEHRHA
ncbi:adiponectin receptor [Ceratobasidium sp. AG-Ba]|nr:adiponectin receptor [Ceratobasidium sp. AG-Ba]